MQTRVCGTVQSAAVAKLHLRSVATLSKLHAKRSGVQLDDLCAVHCSVRIGCKALERHERYTC